MRFRPITRVPSVCFVTISRIRISFFVSERRKNWSKVLHDSTSRPCAPWRANIIALFTSIAWSWLKPWTSTYIISSSFCFFGNEKFHREVGFLCNGNTFPCLSLFLCTCPHCSDVRQPICCWLVEFANSEIYQMDLRHCFIMRSGSRRPPSHDLVKTFGTDDTKAMVKFDFRIAFNAVSRDCIFEAVKNHFPALSPCVTRGRLFFLLGTLPCTVDVVSSKRTH